MKKPRILVVGSFMMDLIASTRRAPAEGETVIGLSFRTAPGGKGANQAVQCARLCAAVTMVGRVGAAAADPDGISRTASVRMQNVTDTTAAGDSFVASFCTGLTAGLSEGDALSFASHAAAITVTRMGAIPSLPDVGEVQALMRKRGFRAFDPAQLDALK